MADLQNQKAILSSSKLQRQRDLGKKRWLIWVMSSSSQSIFCKIQSFHYSETPKRFTFTFHQLRRGPECSNLIDRLISKVGWFNQKYLIVVVDPNNAVLERKMCTLDEICSIQIKKPILRGSWTSMTKKLKLKEEYHWIHNFVCDIMNNTMSDIGRSQHQYYQSFTQKIELTVIIYSLMK